MPTFSRVLLLLSILLAWGLRLDGFFDNHFHADEALFASWARLIAIWRDPLLAAQPVDKPPLLFYLQAINFPLFGAVEFAARVPNMAASLLLVPLTAVLSWRLFRDPPAAVIAALVVTLSPMAIQFSGTAFTDPLLCALLIAALLLTTPAPRPFWAGFTLGLAILTKHQAWLFLPLAAGLAWLSAWQPRHWRRLLAGFVPPLLLFFLWQAASGGGLNIWDAQLSNYGGLRLAWSWELWPRLAAWYALGLPAVGSPLLFWLLLVSLPFAWRPGLQDPAAATLAVRLIIIFIAAYGALHWLLAVPTWDRYLLPLVPLAALVLGYGLSQVVSQIAHRRPTRLVRGLAISLLLLLLLAGQLPPALQARTGGFALGGQRDADQGAWQVAAYLQDAPYGTVLYDHWYSWHWRYAFIDRGVYTSWFAHPAALAEDLQAFGDTPGTRYLVVPADERQRPVLRAVAAAGFTARQLLQTDGRPGMILYRLEKAA